MKAFLCRFLVIGPFMSVSILSLCLCHVCLIDISVFVGLSVCLMSVCLSRVCLVSVSLRLMSASVSFLALCLKSVSSLSLSLSVCLSHACLSVSCLLSLLDFLSARLSVCLPVCVRLSASPLICLCFSVCTFAYLVGLMCTCLVLQFSAAIFVAAFKCVNVRILRSV